MATIGKTFIAALTLLCSYGVAAADPIVILHDGRTVSASGFIQGAVQFDRPFSIQPDVPASAIREQSQGDVLNAAAHPSSSFGGTVVSDAFLASDISDPGHMSGFGFTQTLLESRSAIPVDETFFVLDAQAQAVMTFAVNFRVESPFDFVFVAPHLSGDTARASLSGSGSVFFDIPGVQSTFTQAGHLNPGDYALLVQDTARLTVHSEGVGQGGISEGVGQGGFNFTFDLTPSGPGPAPTPEPASLLLLGTGVVGTLRSRRRSPNPSV